MTPDRLLVLALSTLAACASSASHASETTSGAEDPSMTDSADASVDSGATTTEVPTAQAEPTRVDDLSSFAAPVRARLEVLPTLPVAAGTPVLALTMFDASLICGFLDQNVRREGVVSASCPDGSPVVLGGECNPASVIALRLTFGEACALRLGDYLACEIAARASPCSVGFMRADLPECEAVNACLATQIPPE